MGGRAFQVGDHDIVAFSYDQLIQKPCRQSGLQPAVAVKLPVKKASIFDSGPQTVFLGVLVKQSLYRDLKFALIHVVDKVDKDILCAASIERRDQKQNTDHRCSFLPFFSICSADDRRPQNARQKRQGGVPFSRRLRNRLAQLAGQTAAGNIMHVLPETV